MKLLQPPNTVKYDVKTTDTLSCIALRFNTTPSELSRLNRLASTLLYPGQTLFVPEETAEPCTEQHRIPPLPASSPPLSPSPSPIKTARSPIKARSQSTFSSSSSSSSSPLKDINSSPTRKTTPRHNTVLVNHDYHLEDLLQRQDSEEEISKRFLRIKSRYITDGQGVVSGVLLVTPQTIMFNPSVSDHLVVDRGRDAYLVKLPLKAMSSLVVFDEIAAMVTDDLTKQYIPAFEQFRPLSPLRPGVIVCQSTGEEYAIKESPTSAPSSQSEQGTLLQMSQNQQHDQDNSVTPLHPIHETQKKQSDMLSMDHGIDSMSTPSSDVTTSNGSLGDTLVYASCSGGDSNESITGYSTTVTPTPTTNEAHQSLEQPSLLEKKKSLSSENCQQDNNIQCDLSKQQHSTTATQSCTHNEPIESPQHSNTIVNTPSFTDHGHDEFGDFHSASTPKHAPFASSQTPPSLPVRDATIQNHSEKKQQHHELNLDLRPRNNNLTTQRDNSSITAHLNKIATNTSSSSDNTKKLSFPNHVQSPNNTEHSSRDSGISDMTGTTHSTVDSTVEDAHHQQHTSPDRQESRSSLSDEAQKWLGKHSVSRDGSISPDVEPRPVSSFEDPLIYVSVKVSKRFWCPTLSKHNAIMGVPPNRDQKRRQHWFAIPREKVDQFYGFVVHWLPEIHSGVSTPTSDVAHDFDEGLNIVDDKFSSSPATSFGWELNSEDAESMRKLRVGSIQSASSKVSLRSLDEEFETSCDSSLLTKDQLKRLSRALPLLTVGHAMELIYSTDVHGISLKTLYRNFEGYDTIALLVVRDENHRAFGAFLSHPPALSDSFYGTGECLLFSFVTEKKIKTYNWSGENSFFIKGSKTSLTVGGGQGVIGLWLDEDLYHGRSHACSTFNNEMLSEKEDFICTGLEAWAFV